MVDPIGVLRRERAYSALAGGAQMTSRQLANRGSSWRTVMDMLAEGEIILVRSNERAQVLYALA